MCGFGSHREREAGCGGIRRRPKLQGGRSQNASEPQGSGAAIEERAWGVSAARGLEGRRAGDRRGLRQEPGGRGSEATIIIGNHTAAKLESSQHAAGGSGAPWRFRRAWAGAMSPRSWREQDPGDSRSQRTAESGGGGSREAEGSRRRENRHPAGA